MLPLCRYRHLPTQPLEGARERDDEGTSGGGHKLTTTTLDMMDSASGVRPWVRGEREMKRRGFRGPQAQAQTEGCKRLALLHLEEVDDVRGSL